MTTSTPTLASLAKGLWWLVLLRGILAVIFGILAILAPGAALTGIAIIFGVYAIIDGIVAITSAVSARATLRAWGWLLFQGILAVIAGVLALAFPGFVGAIGGLFVLWTITIYAIMHGIGGIVSAAGAQDGRGHTWGILGGVLTLIFGVLFAILILVTPGATLVSLIWVAGIYAVIFGVMLAVTAIQVRAAASRAA